MQQFEARCNMQFNELLNDYIAQLGVSARELADASGLSAAVISRYRRGERTPAPNGEAISALATGIAALAARCGLAEMTYEGVLAELRTVLTGEQAPPLLAHNFDLLVSVLQLRLNDLARALTFDPSYLSRIRAGQRQPADPQAFARGVGAFVARRCAAPEVRADLARLLDLPPEALASDAECAGALADWLLSGEPEQPEPMLSFLEKLDDFDLNDYIRAIRFDELKPPSAPFQLPVARTYYGLDGFRDSIYDFLRATVLSRSDQSVFICSDMPIEELARNVDFSKKWMFGLALILKKGLRLDMVHDLNRPFNEMMLGLEGWIPLYMTGQISPWYLKGAHNAIYGHLSFSSGGASLEGECIMGALQGGRYRFSKARRDINYSRARAEALLQKALPLMDIYRGKSEGAYHAFRMRDAHEPGNRRAILTAPPLHTLTPELLRRLLERGGASPAARAAVLESHAQSRALVAELLAHGAYHETYPALSRAEFEASPVALALSEQLCDSDISYDYETYRQHLRLTREFAQAHEGYACSVTGRPALNHIQIHMREGKWAAVTKCKAPAIHFVMRHPRLCAAIANMTLPVVEAGALDGE